MGRIRKGFTFIEMLVSVGIIAMVLPAVFAISFAILRQQTILYSFYDAKHQGDNVARIIKIALTTNARKITSLADNTIDICPLLTSPTPTFSPRLVVEDKNGIDYVLSLETSPTPAPNRIASQSAVSSSPSYLTSTSVSVTNLQFSCYKSSAYSPSIVSIFYTVGKNAQYQVNTSLDYRLKVKLNSY